MSKKVTSADHKASKVQGFLAAIRVCPHITRAAQAAGIRRELHYRRYGEDAAYTAAFDEAWQAGIAARKVRAAELAIDLEDRAGELALHGWQEPIVFKGQIQVEVDPTKPEVLNPETGEMEPQLRPATITKLDNNLLQFMLRGAFPEKYRERHSVDVKSTELKFAGTMEELLSLFKKATEDEEEPQAA